MLKIIVFIGFEFMLGSNAIWINPGLERVPKEKAFLTSADCLKMHIKPLSLKHLQYILI